MPRNKEVDPRQGSLLQPAPDGEAVSPIAVPSDIDSAAPLAQSSIYERNLHLIDSLDKLSAASRNASLVEGVDQKDTNMNTKRGKAVRKLAKGMGKTLDEVGVMWEEAQEKRVVEAEQDFYKAFGYEALVASGMDPEEVSVLESRDFTRFVRKYADSGNNSDRDDYKRNLKRQQKTQKKIQDNINNGVEPGLENSEIIVVSNQIGVRESQPEVEDQPSTLEIDRLESRDRLRVLKEDPRAGFLPFTFKELWQATELLTYLPSQSGEKNRKHPAGAAHYLQAIFKHNQALDKARDDGENTANRALMSLPYEFGDYAADSVRQRQALVDLDKLLRDEHPNPAPKLIEEFPEGHPGIAPLIRYLDAEALREVGGDKADFNRTLHTREDRLELPDDTDGTEKHKTVHDPYTALELSDEIEDRIQIAMETLSIGRIRESVVEAIENEQARLDYWKMILESTKNHMAAKPTSERVLAELEQTA